MHNLVLSPIDPEVLISRISEKVTANVLNAVQNHDHQTNERDTWFDMKGLIGHIPYDISPTTVYNYTSKGLIPHHKKGKKLLFLKSEIDAWLKSGRKKTKAEIQAESRTYLTGNTTGGVK